MKRRILIIVIFIIFLFISSTSYCINNNEVMVIGGEQNYPPFEYIDEDGEYRGFNVDLMKALALEMRIEKNK